MADTFFHWLCGVLVFVCVMIMLSYTGNILRSRNTSNKILLLASPLMLAATGLLFLIGGINLYLYIELESLANLIAAILVLVIFLEAYTDFFITFKETRLFLSGYHIDYATITKVEFKKSFAKLFYYMVISYGEQSKKSVWVSAKVKDELREELRDKKIEVADFVALNE